jgi:hypothetical protein
MQDQIQQITPPAQQERTFIAIPIHIAPETIFFQSIIKFLLDAKTRTPGNEFMISMNPGDSLITRSRHSLMATFLKTNCTQIVFLDSDLGFEPWQLHRLIAHKEGIVGGLYFAKSQDQLKPIINAWETPIPTREDGLQKVRFAGTGFFKVRRWVFGAMREAFPELAYHPDDTPADNKQYHFFTSGLRSYPVGPGQEQWQTTRDLSEDWAFCDRANAIGLDVWADTNVLLQHVGKITYPTNAQLKDPMFPPCVFDANGNKLPVNEAGLITAKDSAGKEILLDPKTGQPPIQTSSSGNLNAPQSAPVSLPVAGVPDDSYTPKFIPLVAKNSN